MDMQPADAKGLSFSIDDFKALYTTFDSNTLKKLPDMYATDIRFKDPIHELSGLDSLITYFNSFNSPDLQCHFEFTNQLMSNGQAFFQWQMSYQHQRLNKGKLLKLNGASLIKYHSRIYYHEDFYDMGAMIYQHIPILGWAVKKINSHMATQK